MPNCASDGTQHERRERRDQQPEERDGGHGLNDPEARIDEVLRAGFLSYREDDRDRDEKRDEERKADEKHMIEERLHESSLMIFKFLGQR